MSDNMLNKLQSVLTEKNKISADSLLLGKSFLGIEGTAIHIDTSAVDVAAEDIEQGYTAYDSSSQLITGTNIEFDRMLYNRYVVNKLFLFPEINVDNKYIVGIHVEGYKYQESSKYINICIGIRSIQVLDESMFGKSVKMKFQFYQDDTLLYNYDYGLYYTTMPSDLNKHTNYIGGMGGNCPNGVAIEKTNRFGATFTYYTPSS